MVSSLWKPSGYYTTKLLNSYVHIWERGYHHDCIDVDVLVVGTADINEVPVASYLSCYD